MNSLHSIDVRRYILTYQTKDTSVVIFWIHRELDIYISVNSEAKLFTKVGSTKQYSSVEFHT